MKHKEDYRDAAVERTQIGTDNPVAVQLKALVLAIIYLAEVIKEKGELV